MKTNKNIDRLFQEKLKDFEVLPPNEVWGNIERNLKNKNSRSLFPLWLRIGSAVAILMLLAVGGVNYFEKSPDINNNNIITNSKEENILEINNELLKEDLLNSSENGSVITETKEESKNSISSKTLSPENKGVENNEPLKSNNNQTNTTVVITDSQQENTEVINYSNTIQPKTSKHSLTKSNVIANNNNTFKQNKADDLNNEIKGSNPKIAASTINKNFEGEEEFSKNNKSNTAFSDILKEGENNTSNLNSTFSQENKIAQNNSNTKEIGNSNLSNSKTQITNPKIDINKIKTEKDIVFQTENKEEDILDTILTENTEKETEEEEDTKKWSVASVFAPIFYNSFNAKGSPLDLQFENSPKQGSKTMSYGIKIAYKINKKLSLQSGITLVNVGYKIGDVFINPSQQGLQRLTNVDYSSTANILNVNAGNFLNEIQLETTSSVPIKGVLNQVFGYIEVPLELKYKLNNSQKFGINLVGGFSTLFLNKNEVYVETSEFSSNLGKANNLNNVNFSGNIGVDIDYKINKSLYFNVAPMLKIHTSTFSKNADNFKPYILGVYTGLNYKF